MARIQNTTTYPFKTPIALSDFVIGTDSGDNNRTKNFLVSDLIGFIESLGLGSNLVNGELVWIENLDFQVTDLGYVINNNTYVTTGTTVTFATADPTNPRIDLITVDIEGTITTQTGVAAASPIEPIVEDPTQTLKLTAVGIAAGAMVPTGISKTLIYNEDAGTGGGEWDVTSVSGGTATINLSSAVNPNTGTVSISITNSSATGDSITFDSGASQNFTDFSNLHLYIYTTGQWTTTDQRIKVSFYNGATLVSDQISISTGLYGFSGSTTGAYQSVILPQTDFKFTADTYTIIKFENENLPSGVIYIDTYNLVSGIENPPRLGSYGAITGTPDSFLGHTGQVVVVNSNESGFDYTPLSTFTDNIYNSDGSIDTATERVVTIPSDSSLTFSSGSGDMEIAMDDTNFSVDADEISIADLSGNGLNTSSLGFNEITASYGLQIRPGSGGTMPNSLIGQVITAIGTNGECAWADSAIENIYTLDGTITDSTRTVTLAEESTLKFLNALGGFISIEDSAIALESTSITLKTPSLANQITLENNGLQQNVCLYGYRLTLGASGSATPPTAGQVLASSDAGGLLEWVDSSSGTTLQDVTTSGNTTDQGIAMTTGEGTELVLISDSSVNIINTIDATTIAMTNTDIANDKEFSFATGSGISNRIRSIGTASTSTGFVTTLEFPNASADRSIVLPDNSGIVALTTTLSLQEVTDVGSTTTNSITISDTTSKTVSVINTTASTLANVSPASVLSGNSANYTLLGLNGSNNPRITFNHLTKATYLQADATADGPTIVLPSASGTLALDAEVVHLAGAETITGVKTFTSNVGITPDTRLYLDSGEDFFSFLIYDASNTFGHGATNLYASYSLGHHFITGDGGAYNSVHAADFVVHDSSFTGTIDPATLTANRAYTLPDATGTVALTSDITTSYTVYTALLSQSGTSDPGVTVIENTTAGTIAWTRAAQGDYTGTLTGDTFTLNKTFLIATKSNGAIGWARAFRNGNTVVKLQNYNEAASAQDGMNQLSFEVRIYP